MGDKGGLNTSKVGGESRWVVKVGESLICVKYDWGWLDTMTIIYYIIGNEGEQLGTSNTLATGT